jgi:predicted GH43/DUF377 family glycosyl hydrolase
MFVIRRSSHNPILSPRREHPWEALAAFNPSPIAVQGGTRVYYRALAHPAALVSPYAGQSSIGTAFSEDGVHYHSRQQVIMAAEAWDAYGCEDPRATTFEGKTYVTYTALGGFPYGPDNIKVAIAVSDDGVRFDERHLATPFNAKAAAIFPERVGGDAVMILTAHTDHTDEHPRPTIGIARAKKVEDFWNPQFWMKWHDTLKDNALENLLRSDQDHIEVGAAPIKTDRGWLLVYSYIEHYYDPSKRLFSIEAALLDLDDPRKVLARTYPFLVPEEVYERYGIVPNIAFPSGAIVNGDMLDIYYGAADTACAKASVRLADLLDALAPHRAKTLVRAKENPILTPQGDGFEKVAVFNAAAIDLGGSVQILYRAMGADHTSTVGLATSADGTHIDERLAEPIYVPRADFEQKRGKPDGNSGCEDPRAVVIDGRIHMTYTAYDGVRAPRGAISSIGVEDFLARRFDAWTSPALITPDGVDDKDIGLLPGKVGGNYLLYHRISGRVCADLVPSLSFEKRVSRCIEVLGPREGMWDAAKIGIAGPPMPVRVGGKDRWLLIYHGVSRRGRYRLGAALLDTDGTTALARSADPILEPEEPYEKEGEVGSVVFSCGAVIRGDLLYVYYGGGDKVLGVATGSLSRILGALS